MHISFSIELIVFGLIFLQLFLLATKVKYFDLNFFYITTTIGLAAAVFSGIFYYGAAEERIFSSLLKSDALFRCVRIVIFFAAIVVVRMIAAASVIPQKRKRELILLITLGSLFSSILILSENLLVSFLCLIGMACSGLFCGGVPFRGRAEGEAVLKFWYQFSLMMIFGFFGLIMLAHVAGGLQYSTLRDFYIGSQSQGLFIFWVSLGLAPLILMAGLFPFQFILVDRDHGVAWPQQCASSLLITGPSTIALLKISVHFFYSSSMGSLPTLLMFVLMILAFVGAIWSFLAATTQKSTKRFMAFLSSAHWALCLVLVAKPSEHSISAALYYYLSLNISLLLLYWGLAFLHERVGEEESWESIRGIGKKFPTCSRILFIGLMTILFLPPSFGFSALLNLLGSMYEQGNLFLLILLCTAVLLSVLAALRLLSSVFFQQDSDTGVLIAPTGGAFIYDTVLFSISFFIVLGAGIWGDLLFQEILVAAKAFIIS